MHNYTVKDLAEQLFIQPYSLKRKLDRQGQNFNIGDTLPEDITTEILQEYTNSAAQRTNETIEAAKSLLEGTAPAVIPIKKDTGLNGHAFVIKPEPKAVIPDPITIKEDTAGIIQQMEDTARPQPQKKDDRWRDVFVKVVLSIALIWQMHHSAFVVMEISRMTGSPWIEIDGIFFAFSVQFTGLLLTIYDGKRWYLILFSIIEFLINVVYYQPWKPGGNYPLTFLISGTIAFTIFSYVDLYAKTRKDGLEVA